MQLKISITTEPIELSIWYFMEASFPGWSWAIQFLPLDARRAYTSNFII